MVSPSPVRCAHRTFRHVRKLMASCVLLWFPRYASSIRHLAFEEPIAAYSSGLSIPFPLNLIWFPVPICAYTCLIYFDLLSFISYSFMCAYLTISYFPSASIDHRSRQQDSLRVHTSGSYWGLRTNVRPRCLHYIVVYSISSIPPPASIYLVDLLPSAGSFRSLSYYTRPPRIPGGSPFVVPM